MRPAALFLGGAASVALAAACSAENDAGTLSEATTPSATPATYAYAFDPSGLATKVTTSGAAYTIARTGDTIRAGADSYALDALGRVVAIDATTLAYGPDGQVDHVTSAGKTVSFVYDENGQRMAVSTGGAVSAAYLDEGYLTATELDEPLRIAQHVVGTLKNGKLVLLATDARGTIEADSDGTPRATSPFGARATHPDVSAELDFAGSAYEADVGVRMGVRDYDARIARFLQPDPLYLLEPDRCVKSAVDCSLYAYAKGSPATFVDPRGTDPEATPMGRMGEATRALAFVVEQFAEHKGGQLIKQGFQFQMHATEYLGTHPQAWDDGAKLYFKFGGEAAHAGKGLAGRLEFVGALLVGIDEGRKELREHPGSYGTAIRNGTVAGGVDAGTGWVLVAGGGAIAGPPGAIVGGLLYAADGIHGAITGHSATGALTEAIIQSMNQGNVGSKAVARDLELRGRLGPHD